MDACPRCEGNVIRRGEYPEVATCLWCGWRAYAGEGYINDIIGGKPKVAFAGKKRKYTVIADPLVTEWAETFVERREGALMMGAEAYEAYEAWMEWRGERALSQSHFSMKLGAFLGVKPEYAMMDFRGKRRYCGLWRGARLIEGEAAVDLADGGAVAAAS